MQEVTSLGELVTSLGVPVLFFLLFAYALLKLVPAWQKTWQDNKEAELKRENEAAIEMQRYYNERNKSYQQQLDIMNKQAESQNQLIGQATQVIARSNEVIAGNSEALRQNSSVHNKVIEALQHDLIATREVSQTLREHDERAQKIYTTALRISDKIDRAADQL